MSNPLDNQAESDDAAEEDAEARNRGGQPGNQNAAKPDEEKIAGKGRIVADFGDLKARCVRAAQKRGMKLVPWLREAAEEKLEREGE